MRRVRGSKVWHQFWTCTNEGGGSEAPSPRWTHSASSASVCVSRQSDALLHPPVSITLWSRCEVSSFTNTGPGHLRQSVLRYIFSLDPLMSLPAWLKARPNEPVDVEGCSGSWQREYPRSRGRQVHKVTRERNFQSQKRGTCLKMTTIIPSGSFQLCPILLYNQSHLHHPTPLWCACEFHFLLLRAFTATIMQRWRQHHHFHREDDCYALQEVRL